jgi:hypothetical protein
MYEESGDKIYWNVVMEALVIAVCTIVTKLIDKYLLCKPEPPENFVAEPVRMDTFVSTQVTDSFVPTNSLDAALSELLRDAEEGGRDRSGPSQGLCHVHGPQTKDGNNFK